MTFINTDRAAYNLTSIPAGCTWSGDEPTPKIGDRVKISMNGLGYGKVLSYFWEIGSDTRYLGIMVKLEVNPEWRKHSIEVPACVFGTEIKRVVATPQVPALAGMTPMGFK